jgi:DNA-binding transcriptional regulator YhcF (GntR family)
MSVANPTDMNSIFCVPRKRSQRVSETKEKILNRIRNGFHRPGDRFLSNRQIARAYGVSFQTAQTLITELCEDGWLQQRPSSGTYISGTQKPLHGVQLLVSQRTNALNGVISRLFHYLTQQLDLEKIPWTTDWIGKEAVLKDGFFPIFCDCPALASISAERRYALLLDDAPPPGLEASYIDSIAADDFSGGACAAQLFLRRKSSTGRYAILAGPSHEAKTVQRVNGFRSILPQARVISAGSWFFEDGLRVAEQVLKTPLHGIFCCNDLLAKSMIVHCQTQKLTCPPIIGFDNDPIAEELNLTTIEIPEQKMVGEALSIIRNRMLGDASQASRKILSCRPVMRGSLN